MAVTPMTRVSLWGEVRRLKGFGVVVSMWWCTCGGVAVVVRWWCPCGGVAVVVRWWCPCGGVVVYIQIKSGDKPTRVVPPIEAAL
nr:hypothetical protein [Tanacetum cinerariifolium]